MVVTAARRLLLGATSGTPYPTDVGIDAVGSNFTGSWTGNPTNLSWTHVCGTQAKGLLVAISTSQSAPLNGAETCTYNSVAMTLVGVQADGTGTIEVYYWLANPSSGSHSIAFHSTSGNSGQFLSGTSVSLTACDSALPIFFQGSAADSVTSRTLTTTASDHGLVITTASVQTTSFTATPGTSLALGTNPVGYSTSMNYQAAPSGGGNVTSTYTTGSGVRSGEIGVCVVYAPQSPLAAAVVDVISSDYADVTPTATWSHTCASDATALIVGVGISATVGFSGATYNGVAMSFIGVTTAASGLRVAWFGMFGPATGAAHNIVVTAGGTNFPMACVAASLKRCSSLGNFQGSSSASATTRTVNVPSDSRGLILSLAGVFPPPTTITNPSGATQLADGTSTGGGGGGRARLCSQPGTGSSVTVTYSQSGSASPLSLAAFDAH